MQCPYCGQEHPPEVKFCPSTGGRLVAAGFCQTCGTKLEASWKMCPKCGTAAGEVSTIPPKDAPTPHPFGDEPKHLGILSKRAMVVSLVLLSILVVSVSVYFIFFHKPASAPVSEVQPVTSTSPITPATPTRQPDPTSTEIPLPTMSPPLEGVVFPGEKVFYPGDWPGELRFPDDFVLVEASSGNFELGGPKGWAAKLRIEADPHSAADLLASFFMAQGWEINDREELDSGGVLILLERMNGANQGILVVDPDLTDPSYTNILATVFP
jgi:hypothetical protein